MAKISIPFIITTIEEIEDKKVNVPVSGATVTVVTRPEGTPQKIYSSETDTEGASSVTTGENGEINGWLPEGSYLIIAQGGTPSIAEVKKPFDAVTGQGVEKVANNAIRANQIASGSVESGKLANEAVITEKIANSATTETKLGTGSVTSTKLGTGSVITSNIANEAVTAEKIASLAVTESKIANGAVTAGKIAAPGIIFNTGNQYSVGHEVAGETEIEISSTRPVWLIVASPYTVTVYVNGQAVGPAGYTFSYEVGEALHYVRIPTPLSVLLWPGDKWYSSGTASYSYRLL